MLFIIGFQGKAYASEFFNNLSQANPFEAKLKPLVDKTTCGGWAEYSSRRAKQVCIKNVKDMSLYPKLVEAAEPLRVFAVKGGLGQTDKINGLVDEKQKILYLWIGSLREYAKIAVMSFDENMNTSEAIFLKQNGPLHRQIISLFVVVNNAKSEYRKKQREEGFFKNTK